MTDAHQSPLLLFPLKTTEEVDLGSAVRSLITNSYGEDPKKYSEQTSQLNRARQDAVKGAASDATGRDLLFKWFHMLEMLELRFPELRVPFPWKDAFTQKAISQSSLAYEKASIIFNIAATLSSLASSQARMSNPDGLKRTYTALRQAAGMLSYINENFLHAPSTDMSKDVVKCLVGITLAQASEVFLEKTIEEKKAPGLISKLASQTAAAYTGLVEDSRENVTKGIFERSWTYLVQVKARHFTSVMHYYKALADDASGSHGACLVRLTVAETAAKEARNLLTTFSSSATASASGDRPSLPSDAASALIAIVNAQLTRCTERKETAVKDNDLIYHDILPSESSLPAVDKLVAATPIAIQEIFAAPEVQRVIGPDLFQNLVPLGVHEKASLYSEEKAKIARAESERHDVATGEMQAALEYLGLPGSLKKYRALAQGSNASAMLDSLSDPGAEVMRWSTEEAEGGGGRGADGLGVGTAGVDSALGRIESIKSQAKEDIDAALAALDDENRECEKQRVRFGHKWTQDPAGLHTKDMRTSLKDNREAMAQASQNDAQIGELWRSIREDVALLVAGREALEGAFAAALTGQTGLYGSSSAAPTSLIDVSADEEQASESQTASVKAKLAQIDEALLKLNKIKKERAEVLADLKEKIQSDDISQVLVLNRRAQNVDSSIFAAELEKFKPHQNRIAVSLHHQQALLAEVETAFRGLSELPASKSAGAKWDEKEKARNRLVARLRKARDSNAQVRAGVAKGLQFYADLQEIVKGTRQSVNRYVGERKAERLKLVGELEWEEKGSGGGAGGLASSMAGMSMGGGAGGPPPPPPPGRQTSYGSGYGGTPLSPGPPPPSLPGARQTSMPPAPLPHQQAPYQQAQQNDPYSSMFSSGPFMDNRSSPAPQQPPQQQRPYGQLGYGSETHQPQRAGSGGLPPPPQQFQSSFSPTPTSPVQGRYTSPPPPTPQSFAQQGGYGAPPPPPPQQGGYGYGAQEYGSNRAPASPYGAPPPPPQGQYGGGGYGSQPQYQQPYGTPQQQSQQGYAARAPPPPPTQYQGYQQQPYQGGYQPPY